MIALIQRVRDARVQVAGLTTSAIHRGILALVGVERGDGEAQAERLAERVIGYRIFPDDTGKMNRSLAEIGGGLLIVPQFTLAADTRSGARPSGGRRKAFPSVRRARARAAPGGGNRHLRGGHAGEPRERRPGDLLAPGATRGRRGRLSP